MVHPYGVSLVDQGLHVESVASTSLRNPMSPGHPAMAAQSTWRPPPTSGAQLYARSPSPVPVAPEMPNLRDRISELLLANYALTGNAEWIGIRDRATTIFAVQPPATIAARTNQTRTSPPPPQPRRILFPPPLAPTPRRASLPLPSLSATAAGELETDSTRILDVSMMLDGNYNATADPEWLQIGSRLRSCYRDDCSVFR